MLIAAVLLGAMVFMGLPKRVIIVEEEPKIKQQRALDFQR